MGQALGAKAPIVRVRNGAEPRTYARTAHMLKQLERDGGIAFGGPVTVCSTGTLQSAYKDCLTRGPTLRCQFLLQD